MLVPPLPLALEINRCVTQPRLDNWPQRLYLCVLNSPFTCGDRESLLLPSRQSSLQIRRATTHFNYLLRQGACAPSFATNCIKRPLRSFAQGEKFIKIEQVRGPLHQTRTILQKRTASSSRPISPDNEEKCEEKKEKKILTLPCVNYRVHAYKEEIIRFDEYNIGRLFEHAKRGPIP